MIAILMAALLQQADVGIPANELRTRADSASIVKTAAAALSPLRILSVGIDTGDAWDRSMSADSALMLLTARALAVPFDTVTRHTRVPPCPADSTASGEKGYRIDDVSIERSSVPTRVGRPDWYHYVVNFARTCQRSGRVASMRSRVRFDAMPDTLWSFKWKVGRVEHDTDPLPLREPTFLERHSRFTGPAMGALFWAPLLFPFLGVFIGSLGGRRGLVRLLGVWSLLGLAMAIFGGGPGFLLWLLTFVLPASVFVGWANAGTAEPSAPLALGRATVAFLVAYLISVVGYFLVLFGAI